MPLQRPAAPSDETRPLRPVTNRILAVLPGPDWAWIVVWALVPWLNAGANFLRGADGTSAVWEQSRVLVLLNYAALSFAVVITLWGTPRIARRLEALRTGGSGAVDRDASGRFQELNSVVTPVLVSAAAAIGFGAAAFVRDGWTAATLRGATWFVLGIATSVVAATIGRMILEPIGL